MWVIDAERERWVLVSARGIHQKHKQSALGKYEWVRNSHDTNKLPERGREKLRANCGGRNYDNEYTVRTPTPMRGLAAEVARSSNPRSCCVKFWESALIRHNAREGEWEREREQKPMAMLGLSRISGRPARWVRFRQLLAAVVPASTLPFRSQSLSRQSTFSQCILCRVLNEIPKKPPRHVKFCTMFS